MVAEAGVHMIAAKGRVEGRRPGRRSEVVVDQGPWSRVEPVGHMGRVVGRGRWWMEEAGGDQVAADKKSSG